MKYTRKDYKAIPEYANYEVNMYGEVRKIPSGAKIHTHSHGNTWHCLVTKRGKRYKLNLNSIVHALFDTVLAPPEKEITVARVPASVKIKQPAVKFKMFNGSSITAHDKSDIKSVIKSAREKSKHELTVDDAPAHLSRDEKEERLLNIMLHG